MPLWWIRLIDRVVLTVGAAYFLLFLAWPGLVAPGHSHAADPMAPMGFAFVLAGVFLAYRVQTTFHTRVEELFRRGAILMTPDEEAAFWRAFERLVRWATPVTAIVIYIGLVIGILVTQPNPEGRIHLYLGGGLACWVVGARFGFGIAAGLGVYWLTHRRADLVLAPEHPDRCAGFGRLGRYYLYQALVFVVPALFMIFWMVYVPLRAEPFRADLVEVCAIAPDTARAAALAPVKAALDAATWQYLELFDAQDRLICPPRMEMLWTWHFINYLFIDAIIVVLGWLVPHVILARAMRRSYRAGIAPRIAEAEIKLRRLREGPGRDTGSPEYREAEARQVRHIAVLQSCPTQPVRLVPVSLALLSHISAFVGLITAFADIDTMLGFVALVLAPFRF